MRYKSSSLKDLISFISKGIVPKYANSHDENVIRVINQRCNRNGEITFKEARYSDLSKRKVTNEKLLKNKDILINSTGKGTAGRVAQISENQLTEPTTVDGHMIIIRPSEKIDPDYLGYALKAQQRVIESYAEGSTGQTEINKQRLLDETIIKYPSKEEQRKIANIFINLDMKIKNNQKINTNLNSLLECIFNNYYHHKNDTVSTKLELISEVRSANRIFAKEYRNEGIPFLRGKEISLLSQGNSPTDTLFISIEKYKKLKNIPKAKDILVTSVGTIGNIYQVENFRLPFYYKDGNIIQITPHKGFENYIYLWLNSKFGDKEIVSATIGSTQKALTISAIKKFKLYILNNHELQRFNYIVNPLIKQIQQNHEENDFLQDLKSTLLKRYF